MSTTTSASSTPEGLLHNMPINISNRYPELEILLNECAIPPQGKSRIEAGDKLDEILSKIIQEEGY